ncbi:MAG: hypothetical protein D3915_04920 [Candidatus Electrothrix sp. AU1_5]|nr:hypothetical protein [Candidatus Electrothrix gigas]
MNFKWLLPAQCEWNLHLHDNCGIPNTGIFDDIGDQVAFGVGDLHCPMGWGDIPWTDVLPCMRFRPGTYAIVELQGRYHGLENVVADTAHRFSAYWNGELKLKEALPISPMQ